MKSRDYRIKGLKDSCLAALLMAGAAFAACSGSEDIATGEQPANPTEPKTCTLTVQASKGDNATTRALDLSGTTLNALWEEGEKVDVYTANEITSGVYVQGSPNPICTLEATNVTNGGMSCTLTGSINPANLSEGQKLFLKYMGSKGGENGGTLGGSTQQDGSLQTIADYFDRAHAVVTISSIGTSTVTTDDASFVNEMAIVKFTLKDAAGTAITPSSITIQQTGSSSAADIIVSGSTYTANSGCFYFAFSQNTATGYSGDIEITATVGSDTYTYSKSDVVFEHGKFYPITVKMSKVVDLSTLSARYTAQNGDILTGTLGGAYAVSIADGASVTLKDVDINSNGAYFANYDGIGCAGDATITLEGTNKVRALGSRQSGIGVGNNKTLTIQGSGSLEVWGSGMGAGIGGNIDGTCGNITIKSGTITARGGTNKASAGIGGGSGHYCGVITISGGDVTAIGGAGGAGIGSADGAVSCDGISISSGTVNATGSNGAAGIGCGSNSNCGDISISGGTITATGGIYAAGIGGSAGEKSVGICGKITITGGKITATGGDASAGIGGGWGCGDITISGAKINSTKGYYAPNSIGKCSAGVGGTVTIDGTLYWDGSTYTNGGYDYLTQSPLKINWDN